MENIILLILAVIIILLIIGGFAFMLNQFFKSERQRRNFELKMKYSEGILPHKLQAYERMVLFLERIKPSSLIRRVPVMDDIKSYEYALIDTIQTEYEHNLAQQVYMSASTWQVVFSAKSATQFLIKEVMESLGGNGSSKKLQEEIIKKTVNETPSATAILYLQNDIQNNL